MISKILEGKRKHFKGDFSSFWKVPEENKSKLQKERKISFENFVWLGSESHFLSCPKMAIWLTDTQKIGVGISSAGLMFLMLGSMLFFDGPLLALGNILFLTGMTCVIGPQKTYHFFARKNKIRGTLCFLGGILLVFLKYPFFGILIEMFGFLNLFGDFFPVILSFLRQMPVIGRFLSLPYIRGFTDRLAGVRQSPV
ncbi:hypothetical protein O181_053330 [Austropuccinia psidii MF-1]|uniref:Vesicle transport protein GOT1B n=1 Tax=Austropuccinia psidii MF-1 TaxID=1389203 RepID=A0A9Q3E0F8_9BASI|nr:hypothetical protein [Austropuccinia psidii MF-1]